MTEHERALLLFVAERVCELLKEQAPPTPHYGWDGYDPGPEWNELFELSTLIAAVEKRGG